MTSLASRTGSTPSVSAPPSESLSSSDFLDAVDDLIRIKEEEETLKARKDALISRVNYFVDEGIVPREKVERSGYTFYPIKKVAKDLEIINEVACQQLHPLQHTVDEYSAHLAKARKNFNSKRDALIALGYAKCQTSTTWGLRETGCKW